MVRGSPSMCMRQQSAPWLATRPAMSGAKRNAETSLTSVAPACNAARATSSLVVSMETRWPAAARDSTTGSTRSRSSCSATGSAPGLVDSPPTSRIPAPSPASRSPCSIAAAGSRKRPPSENESGVTLTTPIRVYAGTAEEVCPSGGRLLAGQVNDEPGRAGDALLLGDRLQDAQVHERRIALDHSRRVGEVPQRGGLAPGAFERGAALGARTHDVGECSSQVAREDHVANLDCVHLHAEWLAPRRDDLQQALADLELPLENVVDPGFRHGGAQRELRGDVELVLVVLGLMKGSSRIGHAHRHDRADAQLHVVARED